MMWEFPVFKLTNNCLQRSCKHSEDLTEVRTMFLMTSEVARRAIPWQSADVYPVIKFLRKWAGNASAPSLQFRLSSSQLIGSLKGNQKFQQYEQDSSACAVSCGSEIICLTRFTRLVQRRNPRVITYAFKVEMTIKTLKWSAEFNARSSYVAVIHYPRRSF